MCSVPQWRGEEAAASLPVLAGHLHLVHLSDARIVKRSLEPCRFGEGAVGMADVLRQLNGISYSGWVSVSVEEEDDASAKDAIRLLREWTNPADKAR